MNQNPKRQLEEFFRDEIRLSRAEAPSFDDLAAYVEDRLDSEQRRIRRDHRGGRYSPVDARSALCHVTTPGHAPYHDAVRHGVSRTCRPR